MKVFMGNDKNLNQSGAPSLAPAPQSKALLAAVMVASAILAACGGGGGGGSPAPAPAPAPVAASSLVTSVPTPTYAAGSQELAAFELLNAERSRCGLGLLAQDTRLDTAAQGHADWAIFNNFTGHVQVAGTPLFTGQLFTDRIAASGYATAGTFTGQDEIFTALGSNDESVFGGARGIRELLNAPYHQTNLIGGGFRDIGYSVRNNTEVGGPQSRVTVQMNPAYRNAAGPQLPAGDAVLTYPCEGSTGVIRQLTGETPNPVPGRNLAVNPLGVSIGILVRQGQVLTIASASMTNMATGAPVVLRTPTTAANDPNGPGFLTTSQAFVSADVPLAAMTAHQVTLTGTNNGTAFSRTFTFTTGVN